MTLCPFSRRLTPFSVGLATISGPNLFPELRPALGPFQPKHLPSSFIVLMSWSLSVFSPPLHHLPTILLSIPPRTIHIPLFSVLVLDISTTNKIIATDKSWSGLTFLWTLYIPFHLLGTPIPSSDIFHSEGRPCGFHTLHMILWGTYCIALWITINMSDSLEVHRGYLRSPCLFIFVFIIFSRLQGF